MLQGWCRISEFNRDDDWVWAAPHVVGAIPYYPNAIHFNYIRPAGKLASLDENMAGARFGARSVLGWIKPRPDDGSEGPHASLNISTTMNVYGGAMPEPMREAK